MTTGSPIQKVVAILCVVLLPISVSYAQVAPGYGQAPAGYGQAPAPGYGQPTPAVSSQPALQLWSPDQLDNLVAPVALYPDPLLGQVLAASTYPLEIMEAQQWLQHNRNLQGAQLLDAAKQQYWDPSVQALVAFPDALNLLSNDIRWTTDLGNAFLAQQADVMSAVQAMRARAQGNGRLQSTPQQVVTMDTQGGQNAIEIQPANPQMIYVPIYQPEYVYGPPAWGAYPDLWYPPGFGFGFGFGTGLFIGGLFSGWGGWGGWGWGLGWFGRGLGLFVNTAFFNRYGFHGGFGGRFAGGGFGGRMAWAHDPGHRMGVLYSGQSRFGARSASQGYRSTASRGYNSTPSYRAGASYNRSFTPAYSRSGQNYSASRSYSAPRQSFSAPRSYSAPRASSAPRSFSAPRSSGSGSHFSGGHSGGGHSGGGGSHPGGGGHSSGGGHSGGGGHHR